MFETRIRLSHITAAPPVKRYAAVSLQSLLTANASARCSVNAVRRDAGMESGT